MEKLFSLGNTPEFIALLDNTVRALHSAGNATDVRFFFLVDVKSSLDLENKNIKTTKTV